MFTNYDQLPLILSVKEIAEILCISRNSAYALVRSDQIHSIKIGKQYRVLKDDLIKFIEDDIN